MLKVDLNSLCRLKGIQNPSAFYYAHKIHRNTVQRYTHNELTRLSLEEIEKLCLMFNCTPNDLFVWVPGSGILPDEQHALDSLKKKQDDYISETLMKLSPEKIRELQGKILEVIKE